VGVAMREDLDRTNDSEKRDCVRAELCVDVHFSILEAGEYEGLKKRGELSSKRFPTSAGNQMLGTEDESFGGKGVDPRLVDFLIHIEDKLDKILNILAQQEQGGRAVFVGRGLDIGGGGMRIQCEKEVLPGQILDAQFRIFRYPVISLRVFALVVRVDDVGDNGGAWYEVALEFLDLEVPDKEWIISYVFQAQREAIRSKRNR